jgi:hypothetical protein
VPHELRPSRSFLLGVGITVVDLPTASMYFGAIALTAGSGLYLNFLGSAGSPAERHWMAQVWAAVSMLSAWLVKRRDQAVEPAVCRVASSGAPRSRSNTGSHVSGAEP